MTRFAASVFIGLLVSAALSWALFPFRVVPPDAPWALWYSGINTLGQALLAVVPGLVAGWFATRRGLLVGAVVGVLVAVGSLLFVWLWWGPLPPTLAAITLGFGGAAGIVTQSISGAAGQFLRSRKHP